MDLDQFTWFSEPQCLGCPYVSLDNQRIGLLGIWRQGRSIPGAQGSHKGANGVAFVYWVDKRMGRGWGVVETILEVVETFPYAVSKTRGADPLYARCIFHGKFERRHVPGGGGAESPIVQTSFIGIPDVRLAKHRDLPDLLVPPNPRRYFPSLGHIHCDL